MSILGSEGPTVSGTWGAPALGGPAESDEDNPGMILEDHEQGNLVSEVLDACRRVTADRRRESQTVE